MAGFEDGGRFHRAKNAAASFCSRKGKEVNSPLELFGKEIALPHFSSVRLIFDF